MAKYAKFEDWMCGKKVVVPEGDEGEVVGVGKGGGGSVWVVFNQTGGADWIDIEDLEFLEDNTEMSPIKIEWEVGQKVFCLAYGEGVVHNIINGTLYPVEVNYGTTFEKYTLDGKLFDSHKNRSLFFSEPKVTAELFPPKKPFTPVLKDGEEVYLVYLQGIVRGVYKVVSEHEDYVTVSDGSNQLDFQKDVTTFRKLAEEVKWN